MKREIKFNFWDKSLNKMYEIIPSLAIASTGEVSKLKYHECSEESECDCVEWEGTEYSKDIIPLQYTGLKDKDNAEIFDGDLLKDDENFIWKVYFYKGCFLIRCEDLIANELIYPRCLKCKKVGNVYENPELLETQ